MTRQLVLVHGRSQQHKDAGALKSEWLDALEEGLAKNGLTLPIPEGDIRFPFYGDALYDMVQGKLAEEAAAIIVRGDDADEDEMRFTGAVLKEVQEKLGISDAQVAEAAGQDAILRGPQNWKAVQGIVKAIDRFVPHGSGAAIALLTQDVYQYLRNSTIRQQIEKGISSAMDPGSETVVVGHSLGTVVTYNLLRREGHLRGWKVPLHVTLGSPLAVGAVRKTLKTFAPTRCPECATRWFNALDERDIVALYPLDPRSFPLNPAYPAIENYNGVRNRTENRHGIGGYLDDRHVAKRIYDALIT